jgi:hypothetical protein
MKIPPNFLDASLAGRNGRSPLGFKHHHDNSHDVSREALPRRQGVPPVNMI